MATYVIGDLHGALDEFHRLLKKTGFRYDGSDQLYLLGDYADWGKKSIETLLVVKELDERHPFVHCLMGNHEWMFLGTVLSAAKEELFFRSASNWLFDNHGMVTWNGFLKLSDQEKTDLVQWMQGLSFSCDAQADGKWYHLAHAYPYFPKEEDEPSYYKIDAVWRRLMIREDPFASYTGPKHYEQFICGHTITQFYFEKLRYEKHWPYRKPGEYVRNRIFHGEKFIDLDCGAKCMDLSENWGERGQIAAMRAQLAAIRLEDGKEFYVHRKVVPVPEVSLPEVRLPELHVPEVRLPELHVPEVKLPELHVPEVKLPELRMPEIKLPELHVPEVRLPELHFPEIPHVDFQSVRGAIGEVILFRSPDRTQNKTAPELPEEEQQVHREAADE